MKTRTSFRKKLLLLTIVPLAVAQIVTLYAVMRTVETDVELRARDSLDIGGQVVDEFLTGRGEQLRNSVNVLAADFGLREALAIGDATTIRSVLENHSGRLGADMALLLDVDGTSVAATLEGISGIRGHFEMLTTAAGDDDGSETILTIDGIAYQAFATPIRAPLTIGWVVLGFRIDEQLLDRIEALTGLGVTLLGVDEGNNRTIATTKPSLKAGASPAGLFTQGHTLGDVYMVDQAGYQCLTLSTQLVDGHNEVMVVLQRSMQDAMGPYVEARRGLIAFSAILVLFVAGAAAWFSLSVIQPLRVLTHAARRIMSGQYDVSVSVDSDDEMGELAGSFNTMQDAISDREKRISHQALHDPLTDLPNRSKIMQTLASYIDRAATTESSVAVLAVRLQRIDEIASTLGHSASDQVIKLAAKHMKLNLDTGCVLGHAGDDEFLLVLCDADAEQATAEADRIESILAAGVTLGKVNITLQTEAGIAAFPEHGQSAGDLLRHALIARSEARARRKRVMVYEVGRDDHYVRQLRIVNDLRSAIQREQLCLHFQPQIELDGGNVFAAEALVRWQHPEFGWLAPDDFVPAAEQAGTIVHLTRFVITQALAECRNWEALGHRLAIAVNVSARDLQDEYLPYFVLEQLRKNGIAPGRLTLEVTESSVMKEIHRSVATLHSLRDIGVRLSMDDFGTGHSSLAQIKNFPLHELKIDRSFVTGMLRDEQNESIVRTTIELAHNMKLEIVAEGVEDLDTLRRLGAMGCEQAQGYVISKPLRSEDLVSWLEKYEPGQIRERRRPGRAFAGAG